MRGLLLPRAAPLLLHHAKRWEAPAIASLLLLMQEVGSSSRRRTAPPPSRIEEDSSDDLMEMWVVCRTAPLPLRLVTPPPSPTRLVAPPPPLTRVGEVSFDDSPSDSSGYNDECPHVKDVSSYKLLLDFNCLVQLLNVHAHFLI
jgi:hypothetical protein